MSERVIVSSELGGKVWIVTLNAPEVRNALDSPAIMALREASVAFERDVAARILIITGQGVEAFCSGADLRGTSGPGAEFLSSWYEPDDRAAARGMYVRSLLLDRIVQTKPVIAAVNGYAVGGGLEIALTCDFRIFSDSAQIGLPEVRRGSSPAAGAIQGLVRIAGPTVAAYLALTGRLMTAAEALSHGIATAVVSDGGALLSAKELAVELLDNAPISVASIKRLIAVSSELSRERYLEYEQMIWGHIANTHDRLEGRKAFNEKRPARYEGR